MALYKHSINVITKRDRYLPSGAWKGYWNSAIAMRVYFVSIWHLIFA